MTRALPWYIVLLLAIGLGLAVWRGQVAERKVGTAYVLLDSAGARAVRAERRADSLAKAYAPQRAAATKWLTRWDTLPAQWDTLELLDTVRVPVEVLVIADSAIRTCHVALATCEERLAAAGAVTAAVRDSVRGLLVLRRAPRTAVGVAVDARGGLGLAADRDWGRLRVGGTVTPGGMVASVRWWW